MGTTYHSFDLPYTEKILISTNFRHFRQLWLLISLYIYIYVIMERNKNTYNKNACLPDD